MRQVAVAFGQQRRRLGADDILLALHGFPEVAEQVGQPCAGLGTFRQELDAPLPAVGDRGRVELRLQAGLLHDVEQLGRRVGDAVGERIVVLVGCGLGGVDEGVGLALHGGADRTQLLVDVVLDLRVAVGVGQVVGLAVEHVGVAQPVVRQLVGGLGHVDADVLLLRLAQQGVVVDLLGKLVGPAVAAPRLVPAAAFEQVVRLVQVAFDRLDLRHLFGAQQLEQAVPGNGVVAGQALYAQLLEHRGSWAPPAARACRSSG